MIINNKHNTALTSPLRQIECKVEHFDSTFTSRDAIKGITLTREGQKKFFGFGVCQKLELELLDKERKINLLQGDRLLLWFGVDGDFINTTPPFYISEIKRNENTNSLTIVAYDLLYRFTEETIESFNLVSRYSIFNVLAAINNKYGINFDFSKLKNSAVTSLYYPDGANLDGTETVREVLDSIAEAAQCIYYINNRNELVFKTLGYNADFLNVPQSQYFTLESEDKITLAGLCSATELGDNVEAKAENIEGETQYMRDNTFLELRDDLADLLESSLELIKGLSIQPFTCKWRGNYLLEPGDRLNIVTGKGMLGVVSTFFLNDTLKFTGGLTQTSSWDYNSEEEHTNSSTLGDVLKKTFAKVDKVNKEIQLVAGETASLKLTTDTIASSVVKLDNDMAQVAAEVSTKVSAEDIEFTVKKAMGEGTDRVTTTTGFTFNEEGLHISKENKEITTSITEDGMAVYRRNEEVLRADNLGVKAEDLHATTFLIIGNNSRLEDYGSNRTGCFWLGL